jgi:hypothetical protein
MDVLQVDSQGDRAKLLVKAIMCCCSYQGVNKYGCLLLLGFVVASTKYRNIHDWLKGFPIVVVMASKGGIGKTEAALWCLAFLGFGKKAAFMKNTEVHIHTHTYNWS